MRAGEDQEERIAEESSVPKDSRAAAPITRVCDFQLQNASLAEKMESTISPPFSDGGNSNFHPCTNGVESDARWATVRKPVAKKGEKFEERAVK
ncbi:hypothetical protein DMENIID0001_137050 [Sergentomyia squamirostris]